MILIPKRKLPSQQGTEVIIDYTVELVRSGVSIGDARGDFSQWVRLPVGTDKYPNPP